MPLSPSLKLSSPPVTHPQIIDTSYKLHTMDIPDYPAGKSPQRAVQGPRPTPLKVRKDSHKIRKPPVPPPPQASQPLGPLRPPVIIYTVSPEVIHANPNEFMSLVQRLTGPSSACSSFTVKNSEVSSYFSSSFQDINGTISSAARFASIENTKSPQGKKAKVFENDASVITGIEMSSDMESSTGFFPGILSPNPASLQPIPSTFFSPSSDPNPLGFFHDLISPVLHSNKNFIDNSFLFSPSTFISPRMVSPNAPNLDLFNNLFD